MNSNLHVFLLNAQLMLFRVLLKQVSNVIASQDFMLMVKIVMLFPNVHLVQYLMLLKKHVFVKRKQQLSSMDNAWNALQIHLGMKPHVSVMQVLPL